MKALNHFYIVEFIDDKDNYEGLNLNTSEASTLQKAKVISSGPECMDLDGKTVLVNKPACLLWVEDNNYFNIISKELIFAVFD